METIGLKEAKTLDGESIGGKLTFKHSVVNYKEQNEIDHCLSHHTKTLQRSKYMMIEDDITRL